MAYNRDAVGSSIGRVVETRGSGAGAGAGAWTYREWYDRFEEIGQMNGDAFNAACS